MSSNIVEQLYQFIEELFDTVISKYINLSYSEFDANVSWPYDDIVIVPLLSPRQLTNEDVNWITENLPDVVDFLEHEKQDKDICCGVIIDLLHPSFRDVFESVEQFYETNQKYFRDIIVGCLIEEMIFDNIPWICPTILAQYKYTPVEKLKSYIRITKYGTMRIYSIDTFREGHNVQLAPALDLDTLVNNKLFRFHQQVVASLIPGEIKCISDLEE